MLDNYNMLVDSLKIVAPSVFGASSTAFVLTTGASLKKRAGMVLMSAAAAYYSYEYIAAATGMPSGMVSFFVGLLAAPVFELFINEISKIAVAKTLTDAARKKLGLPPIIDSEQEQGE